MTKKKGTRSILGNTRAKRRLHTATGNTNEAITPNSAGNREQRRAAARRKTRT